MTEQEFKLRIAGLEGPQSLMLTAKREFEIESTLFIGVMF